MPPESVMYQSTWHTLSSERDICRCHVCLERCKCTRAVSWYLTHLSACRLHETSKLHVANCVVYQPHMEVRNKVAVTDLCESSTTPAVKATMGASMVCSMLSSSMIHILSGILPVRDVGSVQEVVCDKPWQTRLLAVVPQLIKV